MIWKCDNHEKFKSFEISFNIINNIPFNNDIKKIKLDLLADTIVISTRIDYNYLPYI